MIRSISISAAGRNDFQVRDMSWSYRIRGKEARIQTNISAVKVVKAAKVRSLIGENIGIQRKNEVVRSLIKIIFIYSAMKIRAKFPLLNSTLNPDTSSDSPSAKSNGVRLVSANEEINHVKRRGDSKRAIGIYDVRINTRLNEFIKIRTFRRIRDILTSYEIV